MDPILKPLIDYGIIGLVLILIFLGWLEARPTIIERKEREKSKDEIIKELTHALNRLADKHEAKAK